MRKILLYFYIISAIMSLHGLAFSQPSKDFETSVKTYLKKIEDNIHGDRDSLEVANHNFSQYLKSVLPTITASLSPSFQSPSEQLWIASSADQRMRIWSWNTYTGGSMPAITNIVEFKTASGIGTVDLQEDLGWGPKEGGGNHEFDTIYILKKAKKKYYIAKGTWRADKQDVGAEVVAFEITDTLNTDVKLFKIKRDTIITEWDTLPQSDMNAGGYNCPPPAVKMNSNGTVLKFQHIGWIKNHDTLTSKWDVYEFDGKYFVYKGISKK
jgi:hypothetical protein